jgi:hypothetical protein
MVNESEEVNYEEEGTGTEDMTYLDFSPNASLNYILDIRILAFALSHILLLSYCEIGRNRTLCQVGS